MIGKSEDLDRFSLESLVLSPLALLYAVGWVAYDSIYRFGLKTAASPHPETVLVGGLMVGGLGKTPISLAVADVLAKRGRKVAIGLNGYGSPRQQDASLAPEGDLDPAEWGDEASMLRWMNPEHDLVVGRDRVKAAQIVADRRPKSVLVMDDGFQHLRHRASVAAVFDPDVVPNRMNLPSGPYREPRSYGRRRIQRHGADLNPFQMQMEMRFLDPMTGEQVQPEGEVDVISAIARAYRFVYDLESRGLKIAGGSFLRDHDPLTAQDLLKTTGARPLVCTAKDWVKLARRSDIADKRVWVAMLVPTAPALTSVEEWLRSREVLV